MRFLNYTPSLASIVLISTAAGAKPRYVSSLAENMVSSILHHIANVCGNLRGIGRRFFFGRQFHYNLLGIAKSDRYVSLSLSLSRSAGHPR